MRNTIAAISAALTFATPPALALGVLAYGDEPVHTWSIPSCTVS